MLGQYRDFKVILGFWLTRSEGDILIKVVANMRKHLAVTNYYDRNVIEQGPSLELLDYETTPTYILSDLEKHNIEREIFEEVLSPK